jgi:hypothetical protein
MNQHEEVIRFVCAFSSALLWPFGRIYYQAYDDYYSCLFFSSPKKNVCKKNMKIPFEPICVRINRKFIFVG